MNRWILPVVWMLAAAPAAMAHFLFIVPQQDGGATAVAVFSEDLEPDEDVDVAIVRDAKLFVRDAEGWEKRLAMIAKDHSYDVELPGKGPRVVRGSVAVGVQKRGSSPPFLLAYHPKTIVGDAFHARTAVVGEDAVVEIVPRAAKPSGVRFEVLARGKPLANAEVTVIFPDGEQTQATTGRDGLTSAFERPGRYGVWTRYFEPGTGEHGGKPYEQVRHYPTLVVDVPASGTEASKTAAAPAAVTRFASLPEATSSFGAVASDGHLYVYGGHIARTHRYHTKAVSGRFHRLKLAEGSAGWEELPGGPGLQGLNVAAHRGKIYRVGGMEPRNQEGEKADNYSVRDCARFDPVTMRWEPLPPLPEPRSSHDLVAVDDVLVVVGGWNMKGRAGGNDWLDTMLVLDLNAERLEWRSVRQPFERRALIAAAHAGKMYVVGGFNEDSEPIRSVEIYDVRTGQWSKGPELPGGRRNGFAPAACVLGAALYVSVGDGGMHRLNASENRWEQVATTTPRIVHRLVPFGSRILVAGGAAKGDNLDLIEVVSFAPDEP